MKYMVLEQGKSTMAEYIWIDGQNGVRSKTKVCADVRSFPHAQPQRMHARNVA